MIRTFLLCFVVVLAALLAVPPLWFAAFPPERPLLPAPGRRVEVAPGVGVNVIEAGDGPPVVLVHGHPGSAYDWLPLMEALVAQGSRVLAYDRVGYGHSDARRGPFLVDANADELLALLAAEDLQDVTLVGWSYGGGTSIVATRKDASRIGRLVLVGSVGPGVESRPAPPAWVTAFVVGPLLGWAGRVPPVAHRLRGWFLEMAFAPEPVPAGCCPSVDANFAAPHTFDTLRSEGRDLDGTADLDPSSLTLPILIIHGDGDLLVPASVAETLHHLAPDSTVWMVPGGGHALPATRPEALANRIAGAGAGTLVR